MTRLMLVSLLAGTFVALPASQQAGACGECLVSRYWSIDPDLWKSPDLESFPETAALEEMRPHDLGIAFSGGGTRSAAATLGELRGLRATGWLDRVRYVSAVSGGSWAAVPYAYSPLELDELLGTHEAPGDLTVATLDRKTPARGRLGEAIAHSMVLPGASIEIGDRLSQTRLRDEYRKIATAVFRRLKGPDASRDDKTFARLLDRIFIRPLVTEPLRMSTDRPPLFSWTDESVADIARVSREVRGVARINPAEFAIATAGRPFLIALGTIVVKDEAGGFPRLVPVEYTPLYAGARQQFGPVGGTYVSPFAYDAAQAMFERADADTDGRTGVVGLGPSGATSTFSLADVVASSGAAPQLHLIVDTIAERVDPALRQMAMFFPHYRNIAVRTGQTSTAGATEALPHGDGGFVDNLGLLPLLARHVRNVIVFVNGLKPHRLEPQLPAYFWPTGDPGGSGTRRIDAVFEDTRWSELMQGLDDALDRGGPQVYCSRPDSPWKVLGNEYHNVQPYDGLNICWVYVADPDLPPDAPGTSRWRQKLLPDVRIALFGDPQAGIKGRYERDFKRFPWFRTFGENVPSVVDLKARQVNVLANFTSWMVTDEATQVAFHDTFRSVSGERR